MFRQFRGIKRTYRINQSFQGFEFHSSLKKVGKSGCQRRHNVRNKIFRNSHHFKLIFTMISNRTFIRWMKLCKTLIPQFSKKCWRQKMIGFKANCLKWIYQNYIWFHQLWQNHFCLGRFLNRWSELFYWLHRWERKK